MRFFPIARKISRDKNFKIFALFWQCDLLIVGTELSLKLNAWKPLQYCDKEIEHRAVKKNGAANYVKSSELTRKFQEEQYFLRFSHRLKWFLFEKVGSI